MTTIVTNGQAPIKLNLRAAAQIQMKVSSKSSDLTLKTGVPLPPVAGPPGISKNVVQALDAQSEYIGVWSVQETASDHTTWSGRLMVLYNKITGDTVATFMLDEYGQPRATSAYENAVALKLYGKQFGDDPEHDPAVPVFAVYDNQDDENIVFAVYPDGTIYCKAVDLAP